MSSDQRFNLATYCLESNLARWPDRPAVVFIDGEGREESWTFARFADQAMRLIAALREIGLEGGDRVLLRVPTGSDAALLFFAATGGGCCRCRAPSC